MRIYEQAIETCLLTKPNVGDLIQPFNRKKIDGGGVSYYYNSSRRLKDNDSCCGENR